MTRKNVSKIPISVTPTENGSNVVKIRKEVEKINIEAASNGKKASRTDDKVTGVASNVKKASRVDEKVADVVLKDKKANHNDDEVDSANVPVEQEVLDEKKPNKSLEKDEVDLASGDVPKKEDAKKVFDGTK